MKRFPPTRSEHLLHQASAAHYNFLLESIKDHAIFMLDTEGYITTWNAGAESIKGYTREEIITKHFSIFYTQKDRFLYPKRPGQKLPCRYTRIGEEGG